MSKCIIFFEPLIGSVARREWQKRFRKKRITFSPVAQVRTRWLSETIQIAQKSEIRREFLVFSVTALFGLRKKVEIFERCVSKLLDKRKKSKEVAEAFSKPGVSVIIDEPVGDAVQHRDCMRHPPKQQKVMNNIEVRK